MRSPLAYPLNRGADMDVGGAADLQTDVMRFMAILSLCLVAIFALVQSMPMAPVPAPVEPVAVPADTPAVEVVPPAPEVITETVLARPEPATPKPVQTEHVALTRPRWTPQIPVAAETSNVDVAIAEVAPEIPTTEEASPPMSPPPPVEEPEGFTLRFESDIALTRLVATNQVGLYAIEGARARRMTISDSRISFWDASTPGSFHEMERSTVPQPVIDALARAGADTGSANWGVTLPGRLRTQLDGLMQEFNGGELVIGAGGTIRRETPQ